MKIELSQKCFREWESEINFVLTIEANSISFYSMLWKRSLIYFKYSSWQKEEFFTKLFQVSLQIVKATHLCTVCCMHVQYSWEFHYLRHNRFQLSYARHSELLMHNEKTDKYYNHKQWACWNMNWSSYNFHICIIFAAIDKLEK